MVSRPQSLVNRVLASIEEAGLYDKDKPALLSFLFLEISRGSATITPVFLRDLQDLYPGVEAINIQNDYPPPNPLRVQGCLQTTLAITV